MKDGFIVSRPIILAICGKSSTGKDSLAKWLKNDLGEISRNIISHTTRPKRIGEVDGEDYYYISKEEFIYNISLGRYLEISNFKNWYYGTPTESISANINIGVFNIEGLISICQFSQEYNIIPIYLEERLSLRLKRSIYRENKWKMEYIRRAFVDWKDFLQISSILNKFDNFIYLKRLNGVMRKSKKVKEALKEIGVL